MLITNIQRFSLHDGPGIRTTIFFKGCSLKCPWCSNPENIRHCKEKYLKNGIEGVYGKEYTVESLYKEILKDKEFYLDDGGVTLSGGEALLYVDEIIPLVKLLKKDKITVAVETCLFVPTTNLEKILHFLDYIYVDIKILDPILGKKILNGNIDLFLKNLDYAVSKHKVNVRLPVIKDFTDSDDNINMIIELLKKYENYIEQVELIKGHNLGDEKYKTLGKDIPKKCEVSIDFLKKYKNKLISNVCIPIEFCII